ncbi:MAG TPA: copper chaperone PCu(A)C [Rhizomicrobium sp.]|nr:copper chaperone PCu(A)C [Rhizomicrobium sp.]
MKRLIGGFLLATALPFSAAAAAPGVTVTDAWLRALPGGLPAGGYFTLHNPTAKTLTLQSASSPACGMLMLHKSETMSGMASMDNVVSIDVKPGATLQFSPGGYHLMCMEPKLKLGDKISVTLHFADGTKVQSDFAVRGANGR